MTRLLVPLDIPVSLGREEASRRATQFTFRQGPVFTNLMLADEINRTPPKTQAALLEAMENGRSALMAVPSRCRIPSWWLPPRTRLSSRAPIPCLRRSWTGS